MAVIPSKEDALDTINLFMSGRCNRKTLKYLSSVNAHIPVINHFELEQASNLRVLLHFVLTDDFEWCQQLVGEQLE